MNIVVELQRRQWSSMEQWDTHLLQRFCEDCCIQSMAQQKIKTTMQLFVTGRQSTMAIAFSCNGEYVASGHSTHEIIVGHMTPHIHYMRTLVGHDRTPWVLSFDPIQPHVLYSGSLAGKVFKWDIQDGERYKHSFDPGISSPINSITFVPSDPTLVMVAVGDCLFLLSADDISVIWKSQTKSLSNKVRLVLHHPEESKILTAVTNEVTSSIPYYMRRTTYRLQLQYCRKCHPPDLTSDSVGVLCSRARVFGPNSCVLTTEYVVCTSFPARFVLINVYSILPESFGECLCSFTPDQAVYNNILSLELSPCEGYILMCVGPKKSVFHMNTFHAGELNAIVYKFRRQPLTRTLRQLVLEVQGVCSIKSEQNVSSNIALWMPLTAGHGYGVCLGTQQGEVLFWRLTEPYDIDDNQHAMSYRMIELHDNVVPRVSTYSPTYS